MGRRGYVFYHPTLSNEHQTFARDFTADQKKTKVIIFLFSVTRGNLNQLIYIMIQVEFLGLSFL